MSMSRAAVGCIGLGLMGEAFARRLIATDHSVAAYDIAAEKVAAAVAAGAKAFASPADVARAADVVLVSVTTTAAVEAAILGKPMVIVYKMAQANRIEFHFVKGRMPQYIGMPNILAGRGICPEFVQDAATPEALAQEVIGLLLEPDRMLRMREDLRAAVAQLAETLTLARTS